MNSIFKKPSTSPNRGRNGFDLSFRRLFTAPCGMMLPVAFDYTNPGDKYKLNASIFARTEAVQTAAFTRFKLHVDWHYVPMRQIYAFWNEFYNSVFDGHTNFVKKSDNFALPKFNFNGSTGPVASPQGISLFGKFTDGNKTTFQVNTDPFGVPYIHNFRRLFDLFGYGAVDRYALNTSASLLVPLTPFLAYHKIFYSHYNKADWFANDPSYYNVDSYHGATLTNEQASKIISTIHYAPYRNDYFHNILPSPTFNSTFVNAINGNTTDVMSKINREGNSGNDMNLGVYGTVNAGSRVELTTEMVDGNSLEISSGDLRSLFAYDRFLRVTGLAGSHYDEQIAAHFGVKLNKILANESQFIGSQVIDLAISEVVASASTGAEGAGSTLGDIAGKGFGSGTGKDLSFTASEHGVIMALFYIEPFLDYSTQGIDPKLRYTDSLDFYHPELDNIGMQPFDANNIYVSDPLRSVTIGWNYRYSELKTNYDKVNEGFYATSKSTWQTNFQQSCGDAFFHTTDLFTMFYINPQYTNNIFLADFRRYRSNTGKNWPEDVNSNTYLVSAGQNWKNPFNACSNVYGFDNFLVSADFKIFKTSIMSVHSLPKL